VLAVIRAPLQFGLSVGKTALGVGAGAVRAAVDVVTRDPDQDRFSVSVPPTQPQPEPARPAAADWEPVAPTPAAAATPPAEPATPVAEPAHVSEEPVQVAEFAEPGAEDGPGPELQIQEPWEGYSKLDARAVADQLAGADRETAAAVDLYERTHRSRRTVIDAAERRLKALTGPAATENR
jgi:hypothetical protein